MSLRDNIRKAQEEEVVELEEVVEPEEVDDSEPKDNTLRSRVKSDAKKYNNHIRAEHFLWVKMWISYLVSMTMKDRGKIPDNIGDKVLIANNMYITKNYMSTIIHIVELGTETPITTLQVLNEALRDRGNKAILDMTCKNKKYYYDPKRNGLESRIHMWEHNVEDEETSRRMRERSVRCLYTVEQAKRGIQLKNTRIFLTVRAKDIHTLNNAEKIIFEVLGAMNCVYLPAYGTIKNELEYITLFGNTNRDLKGTRAVMTSNVILSQLAPNCGSYNDMKGYYIGQNVLNGTPYYIDFSTISMARNMYCVAPSGAGKSVLALNMAQSAFENGSACVLMDIKGNEYTSFIKATDGYTVSLRPMSIEYINSFVMRKGDVKNESPEAYFRARVSFSKQQMIILSGIKDREELLEFEELLDEFFDALYIQCGAIPTNVNSWACTEELNPYVVYDKFERFVTPEKYAQYNLRKTVMGILRMYMSPTGSKSYVFKHEFDYAKIMGSDTVSFDFGILSNTSVADIDLDLFRLKFLYMTKLNSEFTTRQYDRGRRTFKVLEESQIVSDDVMRMYVEEYTLRRSQNQDTLLLGNSIQALQNNKYSQPLIENTRGLFIGELTQDARTIVIEQFGLQELEDHIRIPGSSVRYKNCFAFINNMQPKKLYPIIQVEIEQDEKGKYRTYKINVPTKETDQSSGETE